MIMRSSCLLQRSCNRAGSMDVVFFNQYGVEQANAVVMTSTTAYRIFLRKPQAGDNP